MRFATMPLQMDFARDRRPRATRPKALNPGGRIIISNRTDPVIVEQSYNVSREHLWAAITVRDQMAAWFFDGIPDFQPRVGFQTQFHVDTGERSFLHCWKILEVIPQQRIVYDWRYANYPGVGTVTFSLFENGSGSRLRVTTEGLSTFPAAIPEFSRESCLAGWKFFVQQRLKAYLSDHV